MTTYSLQMRNQIEVNTDPQRRCYNGCHFSSEWQWQPWETLISGVSEERAQRNKLAFENLNDYAVSQRGPHARSEFRIVPKE